MTNENFVNLKDYGTLKLEISANDLFNVIKSVTQETTEKLLKKFEANRSPQLIPRKEAMQLLDVKTTSTMIRWEENGYLSPHRIGSRIFYNKDEVLKAVEKFERIEEY